MPNYKVISAHDGGVPVCTFTTRNAKNRTDYLKIKNMKAENAEIFIDQDIIVTTTNREIVPQDIILKADISLFEPDDIPPVQVPYKVLSVSNDEIPVCILTVHDEQGRLNHLYVHNMIAVVGQSFTGELIHVATLANEVRPHDIVVKSLEIDPEVPDVG